MFFKTARQVVIAVAGSVVLFIGILMILLPGPAILMIPAGLAILALEFAWAGRLLKRMKQQARSVFNSGGERETKKASTAKTDAPAPAASR